MAKLAIVVLACMISAVFGVADDLYRNIDVTWGDGRGKILNNGQLLTLSLDKTSGSGFQSKSQYLFGKIDMQLKLVPGNSAGTVTTYYVTPLTNNFTRTTPIYYLSNSWVILQLSSQGPTHDEIDMEFLGNVTGQPYTLHTNVFSQGKGGREQQFRLWFDPTADFHTYSILWNPRSIIFSVDGTPIREFKNRESIGVAFPKNQAMRVYSSLWDAEDWATQGGRVKTDWSKAPFTAAYRNYNADACVWANGKSSCRGATPGSAWMNQQLDATSYKRMQWVQKNYMIYNYCTDFQRFPQGLPKECTASKF